MNKLFFTEYYVNNTLHNYGIIYLFNGDNSFLLYPGCEIKPNNENSSDYTMICNNGCIQLNRYVTNENTNKLNGLIREFFHIIYPTTIANGREDNLKDKYQIQNSQINDNWYITPYFPKLYLEYEHSYNSNISYDRCYHFEEPKLPIEFNASNVLKLSSSELAKYDVKLWNECGLNDGKYSLNCYNKLANKGNYFNVDDAYKLFYGVTKDQKEIELKQYILV